VKCQLIAYSIVSKGCHSKLTNIDDGKAPVLLSAYFEKNVQVMTVFHDESCMIKKHTWSTPFVLSLFSYYCKCRFEHEDRPFLTTHVFLTNRILYNGGSILHVINRNLQSQGAHYTATETVTISINKVSGFQGLLSTSVIRLEIPLLDIVLVLQVGQITLSTFELSRQWTMCNIMRQYRVGVDSSSNQSMGGNNQPHLSRDIFQLILLVRLLSQGIISQLDFLLMFPPNLIDLFLQSIQVELCQVLLRRSQLLPLPVQFLLFGPPIMVNLLQTLLCGPYSIICPIELFLGFIILSFRFDLSLLRQQEAIGQ